MKKRTPSASISFSGAIGSSPGASLASTIENDWSRKRPVVLLSSIAMRAPAMKSSAGGISRIEIVSRECASMDDADLDRERVGCGRLDRGRERDRKPRRKGRKALFQARRRGKSCGAGVSLCLKREHSAGQTLFIEGEDLAGASRLVGVVRPSREQEAPQPSSRSWRSFDGNWRSRLRRRPRMVPAALHSASGGSARLLGGPIEAFIASGIRPQEIAGTRQPWKTAPVAATAARLSGLLPMSVRPLEADRPAVGYICADR